jgi:hypothetical protein
MPSGRRDPIFMAKSTLNDIPKRRRGRPATGKGEGVLVRFQPDGLNDIDAWIAKQAGGLTRPEAIRRLVEIGLTVKTRPKQPSPARAERAKEVAAKLLEQLVNQSAPAEEQASRKHRLTISRNTRSYEGVRRLVPRAPLSPITQIDLAKKLTSGAPTLQ